MLRMSARDLKFALLAAAIAAPAECMAQPSPTFSTVTATTGINDPGFLVVNGSMTVSGNVAMTGSVVLTNPLTLSSPLTLPSGLTSTGQITNSGSWVQTGNAALNGTATLTVASGARLLNNGSISNVGSMQNSGTITNTGTINGSGGITGGAVVGASVTAGSNATSTPTVTVNGVAGTLRQMLFDTAGAIRWNIGAGSTSESGANAGSDFYFARYNDAGSLIDVPLAVLRKSGVVQITNTMSEPNYSLCSVASTGTCTFAANQIISFHNAGSSQGTITVALPPSPVDGQVADFFEVFGVSATFTITDSGGSAANVLFRQTTLPAGAWVHCIYGATYPIWVCGH